MGFELNDLLPIVAELTEKYTGKESTSISYKKAEQIMGAVMYCMKETSLEDNIMPLDKEGDSKQALAKQYYELGYTMVIEKVKKTKEQYEEWIEQFQAYGNENYYDTVIKGIPGFFLYYDPKFYPQNHILTLDYPTLISVDGKCGIDAIYQYLNYIRLEQEFFWNLPEDYIRKALRQYHYEYEKLFCNLCNIVMRRGLLDIVLEKSDLEQDFSTREYKEISLFVQENTKEQLKEKFQKLLEIWIKKKYHGNCKLYEYLSADLDSFVIELKVAEFQLL